VHCPYCHNADSRVVDTRIADDGASIRRRRECTACKRRFTTLETSLFQVVKRSGVIEPFSRDKVVNGVRRACQGRPVSEQDLALLAQQVEETLRASGVSIVSSEEVGKAILPYLSDLDQIAYLRFASVYRGFKTLDDFEAAIAELRGRQDVPDPAPAQDAVPAGESKAPGARQARRRPRRTAAAPEEPTLLDG
jgi:transcriptional repressor NrdR